MKIENNIQQRSFRGTFYNNDLLVPVLEKANTSSKVIFSNVLRNMEKVRDNKIFELAMKDSQIGLLCKGISQDPYFIKLSDKIYEQETYGNFYKDILDEINTVLRRFYPRTRNRQEIEQEQLNPKEKPPFHLEDRFELEEESEQSKNALNIHEDLVPFENYFRDEELFDKKLDILTTYYSKYDKEDLDLAHNLMPLSDTIQHYNSLYNSYEFGRVPIKEKKIEIVGKKELPKEFPHFALDYVRDFSITEARALYDFLKKIYFNNYEDFIQKNKHLFKKINYKYVLECMSDAVVNPSKQHKSFYSPKLFRFLFKHPFERSLVVSTDISGIEHLDDYGIDFYEELSQRCNDKNEVKDIFEKCKIWASGGSREINKKMARQTLLEFGYCFFKEDKADVKNALYRTCSNAQIEQICDSIQENKVENFVDYAKSIASDLGDFNLEESIKRAEQGLVKYTNSSGETIGVFKESLKRFLAANPDGKNLVVSKSSKGDEVFEEQKVRLFMQIQKMFGNSDKAKVLYSSCQSPVKSGLTEGAMVVNDKGKILIKLFDNDYSYNEAMRIYNLAMDSKVKNISELTDACVKYHRTLSFDKLIKLIKESVIRPHPESERTVFRCELMEFLIKYPNDRDLVIIKGPDGCEKFNFKEANYIHSLRRQSERLNSRFQREKRETRNAYKNFDSDSKKAFNEGMREFNRGMQEFNEAMRQIEETQEKQGEQENVEVFNNFDELLAKYGEGKIYKKMSMQMVNGVIKKIIIKTD